MSTAATRAGFTAAPTLTLATGLMVPGGFTAAAPAHEVRETCVDGYDVSLSGDLHGGEHSALRLQVSRDEQPVPDLQPYLGAHGHLVALREGDLAYLHVHPNGLRELTAGDVFVVRPGEMIATDGVIGSGSSAVDASLVTGESIPGEPIPGDSVPSRSGPDQPTP